MRGGGMFLMLLIAAALLFAFKDQWLPATGLVADPSPAQTDSAATVVREAETADVPDIPKVPAAVVREAETAHVPDIPKVPAAVVREAETAHVPDIPKVPAAVVRGAETVNVPDIPKVPAAASPVTPPRPKSLDVAETNPKPTIAPRSKPMIQGPQAPTAINAAGASTEPTPAPGSARPDQPEAIVAEAKVYIAKLTAPDPQPVKVANADHFVTKDQVVSLLPESLIEATTPARLQADPALTDHSPITVVRQIEQIERVTPERVIAEAAGNLEQSIQVFEDQKVRELKVRDVLAQFAQSPEKPIFVVKNVRYYEVTTPAELAADTTLDATTPLNVIKLPYALESASVAELIQAKRAVAPNTIFYIRTVRKGDVQGIWGIVLGGLIENFARGMAIRRGEEVSTYRVAIPNAADEVLTTKRSSFLGKLIHRKTLDSYVYNFKKNRMGRNPDRVYPGQEIVIIDFAPEELISIYRHFIEQQG